MTQLLDVLLLERTDFAEYRDMSKNIDDSRINSFIREAQVKELRAILGDELYLKLILDYDDNLKVFGEQRFTDLFFGVDYTFNAGTIRFNGCFGLLVMYAYKRILNHNQVNVTRYGVKNMTTEFSEETIGAKIRSEMVDSNAMALLYQNDAKKYLETETAQYPEWQTKVTEADKTGFNFIKVGDNVHGTNF